MGAIYKMDTTTCYLKDKLSSLSTVTLEDIPGFDIYDKYACSPPPPGTCSEFYLPI